MLYDLMIINFFAKKFDGDVEIYVDQHILSLGDKY